MNEWQLLEADITVQNQSIGEQSHDKSEIIRISSGFGQADPKLGSLCSSTRPSALDRRTQGDMAISSEFVQFYAIDKS